MKPREQKPGGCCALVPIPGHSTLRYRFCSRRAVVVESNTPVCHRHSEAGLQEAQDRRRARYEAQKLAKQALWALRYTVRPEALARIVPGTEDA